ncbi:hypothetical protein RKE29_24815, partial [Streptomyces sp. B1866]|uniref:hypothetical protein n=1 Tax=Streptomyces sp. B1866 TaxID=3075431 RepID=UPI00288FE5FD
MHRPALLAAVAALLSAVGCVSQSPSPGFVPVRDTAAGHRAPADGPSPYPLPSQATARETLGVVGKPAHEKHRKREKHRKSSAKHGKPHRGHHARQRPAAGAAPGQAPPPRAAAR